MVAVSSNMSSSSSSGIYDVTELELEHWQNYTRDQNLIEAISVLQLRILENMDNKVEQNDDDYVEVPKEQLEFGIDSLRRLYNVSL